MDLPGGRSVSPQKQPSMLASLEVAVGLAFVAATNAQQQLNQMRHCLLASELTASPGK